MKVALFCQITVRTEYFDEFLPLMELHAGACPQEEAGCEMFRVGRDFANPNVIRIYEQYTDIADIEIHNNRDRFHAFKAATDHMLADVVVDTVELQF